MKRALALLALSTAFVAACSIPGPSITGGAASGAPGASAAPEGSPSAAPAGSDVLTEGQLQVAIAARLGPRWYCDPDLFPVGRGDVQQIAIQRFAEIQSDGGLFQAILGALGLASEATFSDADKLAIYTLWKAVRTIPMDATAGGAYWFDYLAQPVGQATEGTETTGTISATGEITIQQQVPAGQPLCPICLARGTLIDTPSGPVAVDRLRVGDEVWTYGLDGRRMPGVVIALGSTPVPAGHQVVRLQLADGRTVTASPGHPLADGRHVGEIRVGDVVDGSRVLASDWLPYSGGETFDLVASGPTGGYYADGIPLGSTLAGSH